jgi:hypothetical protein
MAEMVKVTPRKGNVGHKAIVENGGVQVRPGIYELEKATAERLKEQGKVDIARPLHG